METGTRSFEPKLPTVQLRDLEEITSINFVGGGRDGGGVEEGVGVGYLVLKRMLLVLLGDTEGMKKIESNLTGIPSLLVQTKL